MNRKKLLYILLPTAIAAVLAALIYLPASREKQLKALCRVQAETCYRITDGGADTLYLPVDSTPAMAAAAVPDSLWTRSEQTGAFVSNEGHIVTSDSPARDLPDTMPAAAASRRMARADSLLKAQITRKRKELDPLDDFARTHSIADDGFNEVMALREACATLLTALEKAHERMAALQKKGHYEMVQIQRIRISTPYADGVPARVVLRKNGLWLLQTQGACLPEGATRFSVYRTGVRAMKRRLLAYNDLGGVTARRVPQVIEPKVRLLPTAEGGIWTNPSGHLCGVERKGQRIRSREMADLLAEVHSWPVWWWTNLRAWRKSERAGTAPLDAVKDPVTACTAKVISDSLLYIGQCSGDKNLRQGYGILRLPDGSTYAGTWDADTLCKGVRTNGEGIYEGTFDALLQPSGYGRMTYANGYIYQGEWKDGVRDGHGISTAPVGSVLRCGIWKKTKFKGERMVYTADRIYGIDISRHQHEKGRKKYAIDWNKLRITGLGNQKRVLGNVDYPISFMYIKATEGTTVFNRYYPADLRQARRHHIPVGTYHFFGTKTSGAQQAAHFLKKANIARGDLPPVLDIEPTEAQIRRMGGREKLFKEVLAWLRIVQQRCGKKPVLYVGQLFVNNHLNHAPEALKDYDVWVARYGEYKPYVKLLHWQLTPAGRVRGITGEVDINVYNGTRSQFQEYLNRVRR